MKSLTFLPVTVFAVLAVSCAQPTSSAAYDVANPYAAPEYGADGGVTAPTQANVNLPYEEPATSTSSAYNAPAVYEEPATTSQPSYSSSKVHTVVRGDTLWGLGKQYGVSVDSIKQANGLTSDVAVLGANLQIPSR